MANYNQEFIDSIGETFIESYYFQNEKRKLDFNDKSYNNSMINYAIQHYLIKCIEIGRHPTSNNHYLNQFYHDFYQKPWKYVNSPLIKEDIIQKIFDQQAYKVIEFRNRYYNGQNAHKLYLESKKRNLTDSEKNQLYSYYIRHLNTKNSNLQEVIKEEIKKIIENKKDIKDFNELELQFYCQYLANTTKIKPNVVIVKEKDSTRGQQINNLIFINLNYPEYSIEALTKTVFHEARHALQEEESENKNTTAAYEMAQFKLFFKYLNTNDYDSYHENYQFSSIELDAENEGYYNARLFFNTLKYHDLYNNLVDLRKKYLESRNNYAFMWNENKKPVSVDKFIVGNMDNIIKNNPQEIMRYPVLKNFYYENGNKKTLIDILNTKVYDNKEIYNYYINYAIMNNELDSIDLNKLDNSTITKFVSDLISNYRNDNICKVVDYLKDNESYSNANEFKKQQIQVTTNYKLVLATKVLSFVEKNFDIISSASGEKLSNRHKLYDLLYDFRDFDPNKIKNKVLKTSPSFNTKLNEYKEAYKKVLDKFNKKYVSEHLESLSESDRNMIIRVGDKKLTLQEFMLGYVMNNMDTHQRIRMGSQLVYVDNIFYYLNNREKLNEIQTMLNECNDINITNEKPKNMI